ncbi:Variant surface glycoprotein [Trypanosoma congolense IL3000]|uniref:Variant surface glycoprotein n=1 Tax=Trypanosoma congolense (strain IL3000) TaxID=1068625 RepID=F9W7N6_TRYCI|nr:Variant surface glycoprotein [Trypanosoma congolense IL3000]
MAFFVNLLAVSVVTCSFIKHAVAQNAQVQNNDNSEQFALLCRIYNVAKNPPINHVDLQDPNKIVEVIDSINASFAEEKQFNETNQVENSSGVQLKPTTTREAAVAQALLSRITRKAHTILDEIRKLNATRDIEKVKAEFAQVIFGGGMNESDLCDGVLKGVGERGAACGSSGLSHKGNYAGKNLVVDFFCLCSMTRDNSNGIGSVCGVEVGGKGGKKPDNHGWGAANGPSGSSSMWASVKKGCGNLLHHHPNSTKEGDEVIEDFMRHLKSGGLYRWGASNLVKGSGRKSGMLGTGAGTENDGNGDNLTCDGNRGYTGSNGRSGKPPGGICVYYGPQPDWENIDWLKKFRDALKTLDALNNKTATIQRGIEKLQMLLHRAEKIYETTKVIAEVQNPAQHTSIQTAAKRLTAYSGARRHPIYAHSILLFVLL